ncbi:hypothetical protein [Methylobacterium iners]|uniref:Uncharacterized protein n=1 Tax=Methylobacterium iners TaxID=418707 RepID=A0ABQ4RXA3_9HYPH|nr:hypothetical protein [Methylobacterium iners]GJD95424.1 hypothetical protein OCOJLMKI_2636 [Methylobacterium iners]
MPVFHRSRLAIALVALALPLAAAAEPAPRKPTAVASGVKATNPTWTSAEPEPSCHRSRRKLWQDGEGWVVKTVTVCP